MKNKPKEFYYTNEQMVRDLLAITPIHPFAIVLDAGSGNKVWFKNLGIRKECRRECEIERGCDFFEWNEKVDWVIGNPPFRNNAPDGRRINLVPQWIFKSAEIANIGFAFLINAKSFSLFTTSRLERLREKGFYLEKIHIVADKRWFGRYYYLIFLKEPKKPNDFLSWERKTY